MKRAKYLYTLLVILIWTAKSFCGQSTYDALPEFKAPERKEPGVIYRLLEKSHQTILGFTLIQNSEADVKKRFGEATQSPIEGYHHGTAICISSSDDNDQTKVLYVQIPMADLHGFVLLSEESTVKAPGKCIASPAVHPSISTPGGIRVGRTKEEIIKLLGTPSSQDKKTFLYRFEILKKFDKERFEQFMAEDKDQDPGTAYDTVESRIRIEFVKNRLVSYSVSTVEYY